MKRYIIYHDDPDGQCAAAIAGRHAEKNELDPVYIPMDYGMPFPAAALSGVERAFDEIWVLDFALSLDDMRRLLDLSPAVTWIDHHVTAIEALKPLDGLMAGHQKTDMAACFMTWHHCNVGIHTPLPVLLISDHDIWKFDYKNDSRYFHAALTLYQTDPADPVWDRWFDVYDRRGIWQELAVGRFLYDARIREHRADAGRLGREEPMFGTDKKVLSVNLRGSGELGEVINGMGFDVAHCYVDEPMNGSLVRLSIDYTARISMSVSSPSSTAAAGTNTPPGGWRWSGETRCLDPC